MDIHNTLKHLADDLQRGKFVSSVAFDSLPSGIELLNVSVGRREFIIGYHPANKGIGVDEVTDLSGFEAGYRHWFTEFEPAKEKLLSMLNEAIDSAPGAS